MKFALKNEIFFLFSKILEFQKPLERNIGVILE